MAVIPERRNKEILVKAPDQPEALAKRTAAEVVQAVNLAAGKSEAIAARRLLSGDTVVTFKSETATRGYAEDSA